MNNIRLSKEDASILTNVCEYIITEELMSNETIAELKGVLARMELEEKTSENCKSTYDVEETYTIFCLSQMLKVNAEELDVEFERLNKIANKFIASYWNCPYEPYLECLENFLKDNGYI